MAKTSNIPALIQFVTTLFAQVDRIDSGGPLYAKLCSLLDRADDAALKALYEANIKFVSVLAFNRMLRRGLVATV